MKQIRENGLTLMELLITITILLIIAAVATPLLSGSLDAHRSGMARSRLYHEGLLTMEILTTGIRQTTYLFIPNARTPTRNILALSGMINEDDDNYFGDPLFPRIDEDSHDDLLKDNHAGIAGIDDDGDGSIDETSGGNTHDDDEDAAINEDAIDGIDNDGDGNVDEDPSSDHNADGAPGIRGMDDDGDGSVDESASPDDDDEDGSIDEDPPNALVYSYQAAAKTLNKIFPYPETTTVLTDKATFFEVTFKAPDRILVTLTLTGEDGESVTFSEYASPRNVYQRTGKRVK